MRNLRGVSMKPGGRIRLQSEERLRDLKHLTTRHYARLMDDWITSIGLDPALYGTTRYDGPRWP